MKRWRLWIAFLLMAALMTGCTNASSYVKESYPLVDVDGKGKSAAKIYLVEGKSVPETAKEIADKEKPKELSKDSTDQMFLVYDNRIINVQKDPSNEKNTLVEIDSIEYAKQHYDSSFLQGYMTAMLIDTIFGNAWSKQSSSRGSPSYQGYGSSGKGTTTTSQNKSDTSKPSTTDRTGSFSSKGSTGSSSNSTGSSSSSSDKTDKSSSSSSSGSAATTPSNSGSTGSFTTKQSTSSSSSKSSSSSSSKSSSSSSVRKNDGSTPSVKSSSKPSTSSRSGGFSSKKR